MCGIPHLGCNSLWLSLIFLIILPLNLSLQVKSDGTMEAGIATYRKNNQKPKNKTGYPVRSEYQIPMNHVYVYPCLRFCTSYAPQRSEIQFHWVYSILSHMSLRAESSPGPRPQAGLQVRNREERGWAHLALARGGLVRQGGGEPVAQLLSDTWRIPARKLPELRLGDVSSFRARRGWDPALEFRPRNLDGQGWLSRFPAPRALR